EPRRLRLRGAGAGHGPRAVRARGDGAGDVPLRRPGAGRLLHGAPEDRDARDVPAGDRERDPRGCGGSCSRHAASASAAATGRSSGARVGPRFLVDVIMRSERVISALLALTACTYSTNAPT